MNLTILVILSIIFIIIIYDVYIIFSAGKFESISAHIIRLSRQKPLVVLLFGIVLGHLFWSMSSFDFMTREQLIEKCIPYNKK